MRFSMTFYHYEGNPPVQQLDVYIDDFSTK